MLLIQNDWYKAVR